MASRREPSLKSAFSGQKTKKEVEIENHKAELGVCRIRKLLKVGGGCQTVGCGCVIKSLIDRWPWKDKCCVVTSENVLPEEDFDINDFLLDFKKLNSKIKSVKLASIAKMDAIHRFTSGLVVVPLQQPKAYNRKQSSLFSYRPFTRGDNFSRKLFCPIVDDIDAGSFAVKLFTLKQMLDQYVLDDGQYSFKTLAEFTGHSNRTKPYGAVILTWDENLNAVGVLNCRDSEQSYISPVWLSHENLASLSK